MKRPNRLACCQQLDWLIAGRQRIPKRHFGRFRMKAVHCFLTHARQATQLAERPVRQVDVFAGFQIQLQAVLMDTGHQQLRPLPVVA